jgi:hypothetical protein
MDNKPVVKKEEMKGLFGLKYRYRPNWKPNFKDYEYVWNYEHNRWCINDYEAREQLKDINEVPKDI